MNALLQIHNAIHGSDILSARVGMRSYPVGITTYTRLRYIDYNGIRFMEQNKKKDSKYGQMAREGSRITWGICEGKWILIKDGEIIN